MNKEELNQLYVKIDSILETATFKHDEDKKIIEMLRTQLRHYKKMYDYCNKVVYCNDSLVNEIKTAKDIEEITNLKSQLQEANGKVGDYMQKLFERSAKYDKLQEESDEYRIKCNEKEINISDLLSQRLELQQVIAKNKNNLVMAMEEMAKFCYLESSDFSQGYCSGLNKAIQILKDKMVNNGN